MFRKLAGLLTVAATGMFLSNVASAQIDGTAHDLAGVIPGLDEICVVCHAPHNNLNANGDLLWNHTASTNEGAFTVYDSPTLDGAAGQPGPTSLLCLGCHDGTVAVDSYGGATGTLNIDNAVFGADTQPFGADLGNDHPVGVTYDPVADTALNATTTPVTFGDTSTGTVANMLQAGGVECASCHDVHATLSGGPTGNLSLLNVDNTNSALCLACHIK